MIVDEDDALSASPNWDDGGKVHNWKNHVPDQVRGIWHTLSREQRHVISSWADELASNEEWE